MKKINSLLPIFLGLTTLTACSNGDNSNSAGDGRGGAQNGFLSLAITDAPIDHAREVWVQFDAVELKPSAAQTSITMPLEPAMSINLLALQGQKSAQMFSNATLPAGNYDWLKLKVTATKDGVQDSYIILKDGSVHELNIPSGGESGLKITGGLEIIANTPTEITVDFDLRKSIILKRNGNFALKPVLRLVKNKESSSISGSVKLSVLTRPECSDTDPNTGNAVYLYDGFYVKPDDIDNIGVEPIASAQLALSKSSGLYEYSFGFIPFGKYTAAFTCQADLDNPDSDDNISFSRTKHIKLSRSTVLPANTFR